MMKYQALLITFGVVVLELLCAILISLIWPTGRIYPGGGDVAMPNPIKYVVFWAILGATAVTGLVLWQSRNELARGLIGGAVLASMLNCLLCGSGVE